MAGKVFFSAVLPFAAYAVFAGSHTLDRYRPLIDRYPFGEPPPSFDPTKLASEVSKNGKEDAALGEAEAEIVKNISFSVINLEPDGTLMVGFSDNTDPKQPVHYYIPAGSVRNGWHVKDADLDAKSMTLEKDGVEVVLSLGDKSASGKAPSAARNAGSEESTRVAGAKAGMSPDAMPSMVGRRSRRLRREREDAIAAARDRAEAEEAKKKAEEVREMERIRREEERAERMRELEAIREELRRGREMMREQEMRGGGRPASEEQNAEQTDEVR